jgi:hypothetical protein
VDTSESRSEIPEQLFSGCWRRMEKISWAHRVRNEEVLHKVKEERDIIHTVKRRKDNWIGHMLCKNCLLKHVIEGKIVRKDKEEDVSSYWITLRKSKKEALDRTVVNWLWKKDGTLLSQTRE